MGDQLLARLSINEVPHVSARAVAAVGTIKRRLGDTLRTGKERVLAPSARAIRNSAHYATGKVSDSASWTTRKARQSASGVNMALEAVHAKYYTISALVFLVTFFAVYNVTKSAQYWLNSDIELEELHAYLISATDQSQLPKMPELVATVCALSAWSLLMPLLNL